jgi:hypothetical protein
MHVPSHSVALPDGVAPIPMPDAPQEAAMLVLLLDAGLYPQCASENKGRSDRKDPGGRGVVHTRSI